MNYHDVLKAVGRSRRQFLLFFWGVTCVFIALVYFKPPIAQSLRHEAPLWTFATSLQFNLAGAMAILAGVLTRFSQIRRPRGWLIMVMGFLLICLGADEMLTIHERIGNRIEDIPIVKSIALGGYGDNAIILCYGLIGLVITIVALRDLLSNRHALKFFVAAALFGGYAVTSDYLPRRYLSAHMPLLTEEVVEMLFAAALVSAFFCLATSAVENIVESLRHSEIREDLQAPIAVKGR